MTRFGDFKPLCRNIPSYPWCNLFYRELQHHAPTLLIGPSANTTSAPVGINPKCGISRVGSGNSIGNIANIIACGLSIPVVLWLIYRTNHRKAAVGRIELRAFFAVYLVTVALQLVTTGSFLKQGTTTLVILTAIHAGAVVTLFWTLIGNALVATQIVEDGTPSSLIPFYFLAAIFMAATTYISIDVALTITSTFEPGNPKDSLHSIALFVLTSIWPGAAALVYFILMIWIVARVLRELRPLVYYTLAGILFVLARLAYFLLSRTICDGTNAKIDGSFIATVLDTAAVIVLYLAWRSITEDYWDDDAFAY
ncbi:chitin synthase III catalytic subunit [Multifurca ochricompacta]|uniref:Chitin synthase III catalytic subunit n=1 Tax=Multifurca ochricompacta TaxID=376703 RepID=A0AAD4QPJ7_9AGAM|nr:chitin synthase III catalytic subunit [Multifurca ochricompacta]